VNGARELGRRAGATERDEVALALVDVRLRRLAAHESREIRCRGGRLEDGDLREHRERLPVLLEMRGVAERQHVVAPAGAERRVDDQSAVFGMRQIDRADERIGLHAAGPDHGVGDQGRPIRRPEGAFPHPGDERPQHDADAELLEPPLRDRGESRIHRRHDPVGTVDEGDRRLVAHVDAGVDATQGVVHQIPHRCRELDPHRTRTDDREREQLAPARGIRDERGVLERREDGVPYRSAVLKPFHDERVLLHARNAVVVRHAAGRDDDVVVCDLAVFGPHRLPLDVDGLDLGAEKAEAGPGERYSQRIGDRVRRELARRDLIEQRSEKREVGAIDERDIGLAGPETVLEVTHEVQSAETPANDEDVLGHGPFATADCTRSSSSRYARVIGSPASSALACSRRSRAAARSPARI
jgi:hypothetical protein